MRVYLAVMDETKEAAIALRFAARRAAKTGGGVRILAILPPAEFVQWGGVQATMEEEERSRAEAMIASVAGSILEESGIRPSLIIERGEPVAVVRKVLQETDDVHALVLGAAPSGSPGPLIQHFTGVEMGSLPCPLMIIPGGLSREDVDRLS